jgi:uncharacterized protein (DUF885 family)
LLKGIPAQNHTGTIEYTKKPEFDFLGGSMDRRTMLLSTAAAAALASRPAHVLAQGNPDSKALNALFDQFMKENLDLSPQWTTSLGLDSGERARQKSDLDDTSEAGIAKQKTLTASQLARLTSFDHSSLTPADAISYDVVMYRLRAEVKANSAFSYGTGGVGAPYVVCQGDGNYQYIPSFLAARHTISTQADCDAYLARLSGFATSMDQEIEIAHHDMALGVVPPDFALAKTLLQMQKLRGPAPEESSLTESIARRAREQKIGGDYASLAAQLVRDKVYPALDRQIALVREMQTVATHDAGVWKLPKGGDYYAASLAHYTTSTKDPAEVHRQGLELVKEYTARLDEIMRGQGLTQGTVGERTRALYKDPKYLYPNTDAGREMLLADLNRRVQSVWGKLPKYFGALPKAKLEIRRAPPEREAGSVIGYYSAGSLDGTRPGIYWINLRDTNESPKWFVSDVTYHEGIPGHHVQLSIQQELDLPLIRKVSSFTAYMEGWALYAEQLAFEMGEFDADPIGHCGQLHSALLRAARIVIDTGLHSMKWSREQAIQYYTDLLGEPEANGATEIERYCVWPGQACSYMLGKIKFLELRERAQKSQGAKFDIRKFHDAMLLPGAVPLDILDKLYV